MEVQRSDEFDIWLRGESPKVQALIEVRRFGIETYEHFGDTKNLGAGLFELRWKNGIRVYFIRAKKNVIFLLNGGGKNDQKNDIKKARILIKRYACF